MKIFADYHTHTTFSHGEHSIEDNVKVAIAKGLKEIAISDHGPNHLGFGIKRSSLKEMRRQIDELKIKYPQIRILLSLEANILGVQGHIDAFEEDMKFYDMVLCGYHFGSLPKAFPGDIRIHLYNYLKKFSKTISRKAKELNTQSVVNAVKRNNINVLTHPGAKGPVDIMAIAQACVETDTALEINSSHGYLTYEQIMQVKDTGVKFCISSDAHTKDRVGDFADALERAHRAGIECSQIINCIGE